MQSVALKGFRLSIQQMRLWGWQRENPAYDIQCAMKLDGKLDGVTFQQAFQQVVNRHAILRTRFQYLPGMEVPVQVVLDHVEIPRPEISLKGLSDSDQAVQLDAYFTSFRQQPFDLEHGAPLHAMLLRIAEQQAVLFLRLPALCGDSSTLKNFMSDLHQIYLSSLNGTDFIDEPLQYADVSAWQDSLLQEEDAKEQIAFWRKNDLSLLETIRLPFESTARAHTRYQKPFTPQHLTVSLEPGLQRLLEQTAQRYAVSLEALLLSGWQALLWRLTDTSPCVLGVNCDGRHYEELSACLGLYSRVVPVSMFLSPSLSFQRLLPQVETALREAIDAQSYFIWPSASSQDSDQPPASFPLGFEFESWQTLGHPASLRCSLLKREGCFEPFALKLSALLRDDTLQLALHFDAARLSETLVDQLTEMLPAWFESLCTSAQRPIAAFPLLAASQQASLLQVSQGSRVAPPSALLHERFALQAQRFPDELAAVCGQEQMSYRQLERQVNRLAHLLSQRGVGANEVVALCLPRSLGMLIGLLGVLKARGAYAPLDPETPKARLCWQLADLSPRLLLTHSRLLPLFTEWHGPILCLDQVEWEKLSVSEPAVRVSPHDLAYIIYTSGSTGQPKGVMISHGAVSNYTQALCTQLEVEPGWHFATVSTLAADLGNTSIFCSLASGGCLHVLEYETLTSAVTWQRYLEQWPIDVLKIVPSHLSALLSQTTERSVLPHKYLLLGGEELSVPLLRRLAQEGSSCKVLNHYGPTETTIGALTNMLDEANEAVERVGAESVAIGRPLANVQAYVLDRYQHLLPRGVVGELYLAGAGVAQGYRGRAEQTGERFVPHGWGKQGGERMYRTGDLGYLRADSQIVFMGRRDSQVKLRGYRIELGEIEATLQTHKNVRDCVVLLREDEPGKPQLVAYVVARQQPAPTGGELRALLEERLPSYMLPAAFIALRVLPLTPNGKVDRRQLPAPSLDEEERSSAYAAPRNPTEEILVGILQDVLNVKPIGIHDHFANLGGHSLLATQVISQVRIILQVEIPLRSIFEAPTVAGLAECVEQALRQNQGRQAPPLVRAPRDQALPLSFAQQRLWFLQQLEPHSSAYNVPIAVRLCGTLNVAMLQRDRKSVV